MSSQIYRSAARAARTLLSASSKQSARTFSGRRAVGATAVSFRGSLASLATYGREESANASRNWISGLLALPAAAYMLTEQEAYAVELERTFIAIKPDGVQRGLCNCPISRMSAWNPDCRNHVPL